jgi:hypothetical protein
MSAARALLVLAGLSLGAYGALLLYDNPPVILIRIAIWAAAGVLLHDFVFAPFCAALGWAGHRVLPRRLRVPVGVAALCVVVLGVLAVPVYDKPGRRPDNATVLDRDYHHGLLLAVAAVTLVLLWYLLASRLLPVGQDEMVEQQRTRGVERQPPTV